MVFHSLRKGIFPVSKGLERCVSKVHILEKKWKKSGRNIDEKGEEKGGKEY